MPGVAERRSPPAKGGIDVSDKKKSLLRMIAVALLSVLFELIIEFVRTTLR